MVVNEEVGVPVFPYDFKDRPYDVVGEVKAGVRKATAFSKSPSQAKIYRELWERAEKLGADAVVNASYGDAHVSAFSWGKANAKGTAIRFKAAAPAAALPNTPRSQLRRPPASNMAVFVMLAAVIAAASLQPVVTSSAVAADVVATLLVPATTPIMAKDTMVRMMVLNEVNSRDHSVGHRFVLRVDEEVKIDGVTIIPVGAKGWGEVVASDGTGSAGKSGRINARLLYVEVDGRQIALKGERQSSGRGGAGMAVASVIAFGPLGLLMKGNNATLKAGEIINGYTTGDDTISNASAITP